MQDNKENPEQKRERLRHEELKSNPTGNMNDALNKANNGSLVELVGSLGWKGTGMLILLAVIGFIIVLLFFK